MILDYRLEDAGGMGRLCFQEMADAFELFPREPVSQNIPDRRS